MKIKYSERLGEISNKQLEKACELAEIGNFIKGSKITEGLFGQNLFLTTDKGEYVLRGCPHYDWQFPNERHTAKLLYENTQVPVPWPYEYYKDKTIFGWEFIIMPRLPGNHLSNKIDEPNLSIEDRIEIANLQGRMLAEAQSYNVRVSGRYNHKTNTIEPFKEGSFTQYFSQSILKKIKQSESTEYSSKALTEDLVWIKTLLAKASSAMDVDFKPSIIFQDFKPANMNVDKVHGDWQITGIFDLMES